MATSKRKERHEHLAQVVRVRECGTFVVTPLGRYPDVSEPIGIAPCRALSDEVTAEELGELVVASLERSRRFKHKSRRAGRELARWEGDDESRRVAEQYLPGEGLSLAELYERYRRVQVRHLTHQDWWRVRSYALSAGGREEVVEREERVQLSAGPVMLGEVVMRLAGKVRRRTPRRQVEEPGPTRRAPRRPNRPSGQ
jgi:hypothetical protein